MSRRRPVAIPRAAWLGGLSLPAWSDRAECAGSDPHLFHLGDNEAPGEKVRREYTAKAICRRCPVIAECLAYALAEGDKYGIYGGLTPDERDELTGKRRRKVAL